MQKNITPAEQRPLRKPERKKKWRLSKKGKFRIFFITLLLVLFGASYGITSVVLLTQPVAATPSQQESDASETKESTEQKETSSNTGVTPEAVTNPKLPTILKNTQKTPSETLPEVSEEPVQSETPENETASETEIAEEPDDTSEEETKTTPETSGSREEGLR